MSLINTYAIKLNRVHIVLPDFSDRFRPFSAKFIQAALSIYPSHRLREARILILRISSSENRESKWKLEFDIGWSGIKVFYKRKHFYEQSSTQCSAKNAQLHFNKNEERLFGFFEKIYGIDVLLIVLLKFGYTLTGKMHLELIIIVKRSTASVYI